MLSLKIVRWFALSLSAAVTIYATSSAAQQYSYTMTPSSAPATQYQPNAQYQPAQQYQPQQYQPVQQAQQYQPTQQYQPAQQYQPQQYQPAQQYQPQQYQPLASTRYYNPNSATPYTYTPLPPDSVYVPPRQAYHAPGSQAPSPPYWGLETRSGIDLGVQGIYYRYREPGLDVSELGGMLGLDALGTLTFGEGFFASADLRYALGSLGYRGSGTSDDNYNNIWEVRGLVGKDFIMPQYSLSPYTGFGYRTLYDDNRGTTSINAFGYRRENVIYYLPIGIEPRTHIDSNTRLTSMLEYDVLLHGQQTSYLSDIGPGNPDIQNDQHSGYGIRGNIMYETRTWALGPFFNYWNISQSQSKIFRDNSSGVCAGFGVGAPCTLSADEPDNHTLEVGIQFKYHFF